MTVVTCHGSLSQQDEQPLTEVEGKAKHDLAEVHSAVRMVEPGHAAAYMEGPEDAQVVGHVLAAAMASSPAGMADQAVEETLVDAHQDAVALVEHDDQQDDEAADGVAEYLHEVLVKVA